MIGAVVENIIGGLVHPRASVRRLLAGGHGIDDAIAMVLLAFVLREIFFILVPGARQDESYSFVDYALSLIDSLVTFGLFSLAVCYVGRLFGGEATLRDTALVVGWYLVVSSIIVPFVLPAIVNIVEAAEAGREPPGGSAMAAFAASGLMLWLLASYIAELHRFQRTWQVLLVVLVFSIPVSFLYAGLAPAA